MNVVEPLVATVRIAATPEEVFPYLVDQELIVKWIGNWASLQPEPGGMFAVDMEGASVRGTFVAVEPPDRVVFTWGIPGSDDLPAGSTTVEILLRADGDETVVELLHHDLPGEWRERHAGGWRTCLDALDAAVLGGTAPK